MTKTVVILGAGPAGLPIAHYLLRQTIKQHPDLRVVLVSPHDTFYWKFASPRFVLPKQMDEDKYLFPLADSFASYPAKNFELVIGAAETLDPERNTVGIRLVAGKDDGKGEYGGLREVEYHTLVIATGSRARDDMPWKEVGTTAQTRAAVEGLQAKIREARSIVVAGAGVTGVEFAGELGAAYAKTGLKGVTIVSSEALPLERRLKDSVRKAAKSELENLRVKYIGEAKVTSWAKDDKGERGGETAVTLTRSNGVTETLIADLVVPTYGLVPNSSFAPDAMRDGASGYLKQGADLRAPGYKNVFIIGDVGNLQQPQGVHVDAQARHVMAQFSPYFSGESIKPYLFDPEKLLLGLSIGPDRGTGQFGSWRLWSTLIWWVKSRHLGTDYFEGYAKGDVGGAGKAWPK